MNSPHYSDLFSYASSTDSDDIYDPPSPPPPVPLPRSHTNISQRPRVPRLSSPRLFHDIFVSSSSSNPRPPMFPDTRFRDSFADVSRALTDANRAVQNAEQALQRPAVVDLTDSPPTTNADSEPTSAPLRPQGGSWATPLGLDDILEFHDPPVHAPLPPPRLSPANYLFGMNRFRQPTQEEIRRDEDRAIQQQRDARAQWARSQTRDRISQHARPSSSSTRTTTTTAATTGNVVTTSSTQIQSVDLTQVEDNSSLAAALAKQRRDAILSQKSDSDISPSARSALTAYKCPICMETPTDATTTVCGHLFCHRCIIDTLKWSEQQRTQDMARKTDGVCPVCRKTLKRKDKPGTGRHLIPLQVKLLLMRDEKGKRRAGGSVEPVIKGEMIKTAGSKRKREENSEEEGIWTTLTEL